MNEKERPNLSRFLTRACSIFTPTVLALYLVAWLISDGKVKVPTAGTVFAVFAMSLLISLSTSLYKSEKLSFFASHSINFLILAVAYLFLVLLIRGSASSGIAILVAMAFYVVVFAAVTAVMAVKRRKNRKKITDVKKYETKFD